MSQLRRGPSELVLCLGAQVFSGVLGVRIIVFKTVNIVVDLM